MTLISTISNYADLPSDGLVNLNAFLNPNQTVADVTFWGTRVIRVEPLAGYVPIDVVAQIVIDMGFNKSPKLSDEERVAGIALVHKLRDYYNLSDKAADEKKFITIIILFIRAFFEKHFTRESTTRYRISDDGWAMYFFCGYQEVEFKEKFSSASMDNKFGTLILADERDVRELLDKVKEHEILALSDKVKDDSQTSA